MELLIAVVRDKLCQHTAIQYATNHREDFGLFPFL